MPKTNQDDRAFAAANGFIFQSGLTKREYFTIQTMQSLLLEWEERYDPDFENVSARAVKAADALIVALNKK